MKPKSHTLFHFTKNREVLKQILKSGYWPRYCLEDIHWLPADGLDFIAFPVVCFCDIPLSRIQEHVDFYGSYGLGMTKSWAEANGLNPVMYVSNGSNIPQIYADLNSSAEATDEEKKEALQKSLRYFIAFSKPCDGSMVVDGTPVAKEFYQESEWRFVATSSHISEFLNQSDFEDSSRLETANELTRKHCKLEISPTDIKYIFVQSDSDIPDMMNFIQTELDSFTSADLKILMSRVISLESISNDL